MSCKVETRIVNSIAIIELSGRISLGDGAGVIRDCVRQQVDQGHYNIVLNLAEVTYLDSAAGLGELVGCYATLSSRGGKLKLLNPRKTVRELLQITKLDTVFEIFTDEAAALHSFQKAVGGGQWGAKAKPVGR